MFISFFSVSIITLLKTANCSFQHQIDTIFFAVGVGNIEKEIVWGYDKGYGKGEGRKCPIFFKLQICPPYSTSHY